MIKVGWGRRLPNSTRKPPGRGCLLPASSVRRPAQAGFVLIIFDAPIRRQGHHPRSASDPEGVGRAAQNRPPTRLAATTDARTDLGPLPTSPTDGYRVLGYVAHFRAVAATCLSGVQTNLRLAPNSPTNGFRAHGPHTCQPRPSSMGHGLLLLPPATLPVTGEARTHLGPPSVWPADGLRAHGPHLSIVGGPQLTAARCCSCCHCRRSRRI